MQTVETEADAVKLIFIYGNLWQLQTVKNSVSCLFTANDKQLWITYCIMETNAIDDTIPKVI